MLLAGCAKSDPVEPMRAGSTGKAAISPNYVPFMPPTDSADRTR